MLGGTEQEEKRRVGGKKTTQRRAYVSLSLLEGAVQPILKQWSVLCGPLISCSTIRCYSVLVTGYC